MPRKVFVAGEILTASDVNTNLMDQAVMVFDDATDRATAIPTPVEGMLTYLESVGGPGGLEVFDGTDFVTASPPITREALPAGSILQVVSTTKVDAFSTTSTTYTDVPGFTVSITPTSATSKVLVLSTLYLANDTPGGPFTRAQVLRDSTAIGNNATHNASMAMSNPEAGQRNMYGGGFVFLDTPETTSALTYKVQVLTEATRVGFVNRSGTETATGSSHITVMEVAG